MAGRTRTPKRLEGALESWNVHKGYGFISLPLGRKSVFVHIRAFEGLEHAPRVGQVFSFEPLIMDDGRMRGQHVRLVKDAPDLVARSRSAAGPIVGSLVFAIFVIEYVLLAILYPMPLWPVALWQSGRRFASPSTVTPRNRLGRGGSMPGLALRNAAWLSRYQVRSNSITLSRSCELKITSK